MRKYLFIISVILICILVQAGSTQEVSDTLKAPVVSQVKPEKNLPPIEMEEYTIVGLAKVTLPHKVRRTIFQDVEINWSENENIYQKELPAITFQFSRIKPSLFRLYEFPWFDSRIHYGSYNTAGVNVSMQFRANKTMPYLSVGFENSEGHVERADWTEVSMKAGIHQRVGFNHLLHIFTDYNFAKRGIWGNPATFNEDSEVLTNLWKTGAEFEQHWSEEFRTSIAAAFYRDDHENIEKYEDRGWDLHGQAVVSFGKTSAGLTADYSKTDISAFEGNLEVTPLDSIIIRDFESSLTGGLFYLQQEIKPVSIEAGVLYQKGKQNSLAGMSVEVNPEKVNPYAAISVGLGGKVKFFGKYRPGLEIVRMRDQIRMLPFTEFSSLKLQENRSRLETGFSLNVYPEFSLDVIGRFSKIENYPAPAIHSDSIPAAMAVGGYPGWIVTGLEEVKLNEITGKIDWNFVPSLRLHGWVTFLHSDIRKTGQFSPGVRTNDVPYIPDLSGFGKLGWNFYRQHEISVSVRYVGNRFDDLQNQNELPAYFLFNSQLDLRFGENVIFFLTGQNLLDKKYDIWKGFVAPGITGYAGIRLVL